MPLSNLNTEQKEAATCEKGHNLIIASAGTGKTSTIVGRIAYLLNNGIKPEEIMLLTFTNKASKEMIQRVAKYFDESLANRILSGTFHSISYRLLKQFDDKIALKQPRELKTLLRSIYEKRTFISEEEVTAYSSNYIFDMYSLYRNSFDGTFKEFIESRNKEHSIFSEIYQDIVDEYESNKKEYGYVGFDDLLVNMIELLSTKRLPIREVLVDEYQDTNYLQGKFIDSIKSESLFCVGDYDQSIYAFNGADIGIIGSFDKRYKNAKIFNLSKNYRSTKYILSLANRVIEHNDRIYPKKLEVIRDDENSKAPTLLAYNDIYNQYSDIASRIKNSKSSYEDIAIIFRNNSTADGVEANLRELDIPSKRKGGVSFFDTKEVKAILDVLTLLINPKDLMAFIHIFEYAKGVGSATAKEIYEGFRVLGDGNILDGLIYPNQSISNPFTKNRRSRQLGLFDDMFEFGSISDFKKGGIKEPFLSNPILKHPKLSLKGGLILEDLYNLYKRLKRVKHTYKAIEIIEESKLFLDIKDILSTQRSIRKDGTIDKSQKDEAVIRIDSKITLLKKLSRNYRDIPRFLNAMVLGATEMSEGSGVNLLTIHASKGLEFDEVYVVDLMQDRFPNRTLISKGGTLEEERRLFYVAVTRARDTLYLSYAKGDSQKRVSYLPSIFLYESSMLKKEQN
jgi:DNA helicase-2/ATP-dependent DNA helicase PcrA